MILEDYSLINPVDQADFEAGQERLKGLRKQVCPMGDLAEHTEAEVRMALAKSEATATVKKPFKPLLYKQLNDVIAYILANFDSVADSIKARIKADAQLDVYQPVHLATVSHNVVSGSFNDLIANYPVEGDRDALIQLLLENKQYELDAGVTNISENIVAGIGTAVDVSINFISAIPLVIMNQFPTIEHISKDDLGKIAKNSLGTIVHIARSLHLKEFNGYNYYELGWSNNPSRFAQGLVLAMKGKKIMVGVRGSSLKNNFGYDSPKVGCPGVALIHKLYNIFLEIFLELWENQIGTGIEELKNYDMMVSSY